MPIHPTAHVDKHAEIDPTAEIGINVVIDGPVRIGPGTKVYPNAYIAGWTTIGANCQVHPFAVVGHLPQDFHFGGERSYCEIGDGTILREGVSVHRGTQPESKTILGRNCFLLGYSHVGHNCVLGDDVKLINGALVAGHVEIGQGATLSGHVLVHQFVRIGEYVMAAGGARATMDIPPFMICHGESTCVGLNIVGLRRAGFSTEERAAIKEAYRRLYRTSVPFSRAIESLCEMELPGRAARLREFLRAPSKRGVCGPPKGLRRYAAGADVERREV